MHSPRLLIVPTSIDGQHPVHSKVPFFQLTDVLEWYRRNRSLLGRTVCCLYLFIISCIMFNDCKPYYVTFFAYLTNWGLTIAVLYFFCSLVHEIRIRRRSFFTTPVCRPLSSALSASTCCQVPRDEKTARSPTSGYGPKVTAGLYSYYDPTYSLHSLWWKIFEQSLGELVFVVQVVIVTFFWGYVFPQEPNRPIWWEIQTHGMGLVLMILDYAYRRFHKFSLRNHKWILLFGITYFFCHMVVVISSGEPIYPGINFRDLRSFLISLAAIVVLVFTHKVVYVYSHWTQIKRDAKSVLGIFNVFLLGQHGHDSPLVVLWQALSTRTRPGSCQRHPFSRLKKSWCTHVCGASMEKRIASGYTARWEAVPDNLRKTRCNSMMGLRNRVSEVNYHASKMDKCSSVDGLEDYEYFSDGECPSTTGFQRRSDVLDMIDSTELVGRPSGKQSVEETPCGTRCRSCSRDFLKNPTIGNNDESQLGEISQAFVHNRVVSERFARERTSG